MLTQTTHCNDDQLRRLLEGTLSIHQEAAIENHIADCTRCRQGLEGLAAGAGWWTETRDLLGVGDSTRLPAAATDDSVGNNLAEPVHVEIPPLTFLTRSDNPAMLGRLGEFEVLEFIGRGGMGIVLKGYDHELNRFVAIKVLAPHYAENGAARKRFAREAQAAAAVVHQHVVAIHAVDATHQPPYFVMAYVPGESLQQRLDREGPLLVEEALRIGQQVAEGLAAAHAQGLVHRDIKPSNILLERNVERVLLTDFGLARAVDDASMTQSGIIAGTPQYMSPEQARGEAVDARADLFSLGSVMYSMLAGHPPFRAESPYGVLRRVTDDKPRSLCEINPAVPEWLEELVGRLMAKRPDDRWQDASLSAELLTQCLAHVRQPAMVALPSEVQQLARQGRSRVTRRVGIAISILLCLALSGVVRNLWLQPEGTQPDILPRTAGSGLTTDDSGSSQSPVPKSPASETSTFTTDVPQSESTSWEGDHESVRNSIETRLRHLESQPEF